jgi:hypothetical protein
MQSILPDQQCPSIVKQRHQPDDPHVQSNNHEHKYEVHKSQVVPQRQYWKHFGNKSKINVVEKRFKVQGKTYNWKVSLYFGDQLLVLDFVAIFLFLSWRCGPVRLIST